MVIPISMSLENASTPFWLVNANRGFGVSFRAVSTDNQFSLKEMVRAGSITGSRPRLLAYSIWESERSRVTNILNICLVPESFMVIFCHLINPAVTLLPGQAGFWQRLFRSPRGSQPAL